MWEIRILSVGKMKNKALKEEADRLLKMIKNGWKISVSEVPSSTAQNPTIRKKVETKDLLSKIPKEFNTYFLDCDGIELSGQSFYNIVVDDMEKGKNLCFAIGGPYGFDYESLGKDKKFISLSKMTFSHELIKVMLLEQIYRAYTIYKNIPYAK